MWAGTTALILLALFAVPTAEASHSYNCTQDGKNTQCNEVGFIAMDTQREIRGNPIEVTIDATIDDTYSDAGARYVMFAVRHDPGTGQSPISLDLVKFSSSKGPIFTQRVDHDVPNEINAWAHVADIPQGEPIQMVIKVGASDRGAFRLETLVMPFDRGYEPLRGSSGEEITLFSFTMLGVNKETSSVGGSGGSLLDKVRIPGPAPVLVAAALVAVALLVRRRGA